MIKRTAVLAAALMVAAGCITANAASIRGGDVNGDGRRNVTDISKLAAHVKGIKALDKAGLAQADTNGDSKVNVSDITLLASYVKGISGDGKSKSPTADDMALELAKLVNNERRARGLTPYIYSPELNEAAMLRAKELVTKFDHTRPDGRSCFTVFSDLGINRTKAAENISYGQTSPQMAFQGFMNSEQHRGSMLDASMKYMGMGVCRSSSGTLFWTQLFAAGSGMTGKAV
ncbi:CAP domain-containing protein [uncultured Ruminococcus sp.]|uniref:CAP domain-containing protein n=1 Tax=uncultured Ruminococcus sp. TaxID=165186 RepID=UPI0025CD4659|nr:CAP domain-containing protein [uncultured Ruminococcus sp.]